MIYPDGVQEKLIEITSKDTDKLLQEDIDYIRARRYYLDEYQQEKFAEFLAEPKKEPEVEVKKETKKKK